MIRYHLRNITERKRWQRKRRAKTRYAKFLRYRAEFLPLSVSRNSLLWRLAQWIRQALSMLPFCRS
jgi:hypothetical protein